MTILHLDLDASPEDFMTAVRVQISAQEGLTQKELADQAGVSRSQLSRWVQGHVRPSIGSRFLLKRALEELENGNNS